MATCAEIIGAKLPDNAGEDSVSLLPALLGKADRPLREARGPSLDQRLVRDPRRASGSWASAPAPAAGAPRGRAERTPAGCRRSSSTTWPPTSARRRNVQDQHPEVVARLTRLLEKYVADGRSTPGTPQKNTGQVRTSEGEPGRAAPLARAGTEVGGPPGAATRSTPRPEGPTASAWPTSTATACPTSPPAGKKEEWSAICLHPGADRVRDAWPSVTSAQSVRPRTRSSSTSMATARLDVVSCCEGTSAASSPTGPRATRTQARPAGLDDGAVPRAARPGAMDVLPADAGGRQEGRRPGHRRQEPGQRDRLARGPRATARPGRLALAPDSARPAGSCR